MGSEFQRVFQFNQIVVVAISIGTYRPEQAMITQLICRRRLRLIMVYTTAHTAK